MISRVEGRSGSGRGGRALRLGRGLVLLAVLAVGCAPRGTAHPQPAADPVDVRVPVEAPEPDLLAQLPAMWRREAARSALRLELGPLEGPGNFDEIVGPLPTGARPDSPYLVIDGDDRERKLVVRRPAAAVKAAFDDASKAFGEGRMPEALEGFRKVVQLDPTFAKPYFYVGAVFLQQRDLDKALEWDERGLRLSPRDPFGYALRAEILAARGNTGATRHALAYAAALDPHSPSVLRMLVELGGERRPGITPPVLVRREGAAVVARGGGHPAWQQYAMCRALISYDARVRSEFLQQKLAAGVRSLHEETACGYLATAAYRLSRGSGGPAADADLERWSEAYDLNLLREAIVYETIGARRPEILQLLPDAVQSRMTEYTAVFVLPRPGLEP